MSMQPMQLDAALFQQKFERKQKTPILLRGPLRILQMKVIHEKTANGSTGLVTPKLISVQT